MFNTTLDRWVPLSQALDLLAVAGVPGTALTAAQRSGELPYAVVNGTHIVDPDRLANLVNEGRSHGK